MKKTPSLVEKIEENPFSFFLFRVLISFYKTLNSFWEEKSPSLSLEHFRVAFRVVQN